MKSFSTFIAELSKPAAVDDLRSQLSHIKNVDTRNSGWMKSVVDVLKDYGFKKVGSGKYASVFINPKYQYALKNFYEGCCLPALA
jgi:hypothetical protein